MTGASLRLEPHPGGLETAACAERILVLVEDRDLLNKVRVNARRGVEPYGVNHIAPQVMGVYEDVVGRRK
jgi:hypothetical protein